jgi:hypothetical protein
MSFPLAIECAANFLHHRRSLPVTPMLFRLAHWSMALEMLLEQFLYPEQGKTSNVQQSAQINPLHPVRFSDR